MVHLPELLPVVLVHGGLYDEPPMTAESFWVDTGVAPMLERRNVELLVHVRPAEPVSWAEESRLLVAAIEEAGFERVALVAGSNGCSTALRVLLDRPELVARTMLCWPATAGDPVVDELARIIIADVHGDVVAKQLLAGRPVRGVEVGELAAIATDVVIYPSMPENRAHARSTIAELLASIPGVMMIGGSPEPFHDEFAEYRDGFVDVIEAFSKVVHDD